MIQFTALITANEFISLISYSSLKSNIGVPTTTQNKVWTGKQNKKPNNNNKTLLFCPQSSGFPVCTLLQFSLYLASLLASYLIKEDYNFLVHMMITICKTNPRIALIWGLLDEQPVQFSAKKRFYNIEDGKIILRF